LFDDGDCCVDVGKHFFVIVVGGEGDRVVRELLLKCSDGLKRDDLVAATIFTFNPELGFSLDGGGLVDDELVEGFGPSGGVEQKWRCAFPLNNDRVFPWCDGGVGFLVIKTEVFGVYVGV